MHEGDSVDQLKRDCSTIESLVFCVQWSCSRRGSMSYLMCGTWCAKPHTLHGLGWKIAHKTRNFHHSSNSSTF